MFCIHMGECARTRAICMGTSLVVKIYNGESSCNCILVLILYFSILVLEITNIKGWRERDRETDGIEDLSAIVINTIALPSTSPCDYSIAVSVLSHRVPSVVEH